MKSERMVLIAIDGIDGTGKSTQVKLLMNYLSQSGKFDQVSTIHFPTYSNPSGQLIQTSLDPKYPRMFDDSFTLQLLFEFNRRESLQALRNAKQNSHICLVLDRYFQSGLSYSKPRISEAEFMVLLGISSLVPEADLTFILDISPITARVRTHRRNNQDSFERDVAYQTQVRQAFLDLAQVYDWNVINAEGRTKEQIHNDILSVYNISSSKDDITRK